MGEGGRDLAALIGSRICHDLISPIGAIGNGLELLAMDGSGLGPEMSLITESVSNANARIRFYRIAYGLAGAEQQLGRSEVTKVLGALMQGQRLRVEWRPAGDVGRREVKLAFLLLQCMETALPYGGDVAIIKTDDTWQITGKAEKQRAEPELWALLSNPSAEAAVTPAQVQFLMAPALAAEMGRRIVVETTSSRITVRF